MCFRFLSLFLGPTLFYDLAGSSQGQGIWWDIFSDRSGGGDIGAPPDAQGGDEDAVATDEDAVLDDGLVFAHTVVIASDGSGADVDLFADFAVSEIGEVVGFGALAEAALL